jgi:hypothetical protein
MLPPVFGYSREFGARYVSAVCGQQDLDASRSHTIAGAPAARSQRGGVAVGPPPLDELEKLAAAAPMFGAEYLTPTILEALWNELGAAFQSELAESKTSVQEFLRRKSPTWNVVGRVHFNLAENRLDAEAPFAFLATYADLRAKDWPLSRPEGDLLSSAAAWTGHGCASMSPRCCMGSARGSTSGRSCCSCSEAWYQQDLIAKADWGLRPARKGPVAAKVLNTGDLSQIFVAARMKEYWRERRRDER